MGQILTGGASLEAAGGAKVLIVEDEFLVALQLEDILSDGGHAVLGSFPDAASVAMLGEAPDVALVDLNLRDGLTGPAIAREIAIKFGSRVIYVTANPGQIDLPATTAVGVVQKPFSREAILSAVAYALAGCPPVGRPRELEHLNTARNAA
ncbi:response regulator receiver domain-containing protein [Novosphingobium sp. PhB165]|uniref:response regulator n=1 Tax=Novosphingobium sp. PhB165 TaxID=2485105 RepID=UPI0010D20632|nr:response regulator [Novosphingobium sp. PhB165]TCM18105.1 response regulator receiver domain-containing protein [Novosphingobium sp. PhB165]